MQVVLNNLPQEADLKKWTDTYLPALRKKQDMTSNSAFKSDLKKGIPAQIRGEVWLLFTKNPLHLKPKLYATLLERVRLAEINHDNDEQFKKNINVIEKDLHRTFGELGSFRVGGFLYQPLKNILAAFSVFRTDLGYVQGMSYVAASMLLHIGDEY